MTSQRSRPQTDGGLLVYPEPQKPKVPAVTALLYLFGVGALLFGASLAIFGLHERLPGLGIAIGGIVAIFLAQQVEQFGESAFAAGVDFEKRRAMFEATHPDEFALNIGAYREKLAGPIGNCRSLRFKSSVLLKGRTNSA